jgi:hypothetical protein
MTPDEFTGLLTESLHHHQKWRDVGSIILLIGVIAEILIDEFWEFKHPPLLRGKKATSLLTTTRHRIKKAVMLFVGIILVGGGISLEWWYGKEGDQDAEIISRVQQLRIADAETEQSAFERLVSPRRIVLNNDFRRLSKFAGTPYWIQTAGFGAAINLSSDDFNKVQETASFSGNFAVLRDCCGWELNTTPSAPPQSTGIDSEGVHI